MTEGNLEKGRKIWDKFIPFIELFIDPKINERAHWLEKLKWAATVQGVPVGVPRRPLRALNEETKRQLQKPLEILLSLEREAVAGRP